MIDYFRMLTELKRAGVHNCDVAEAIGVVPNTVQQWKTGSIPRADHAFAFILFYCETLKPSEIHLISSSLAYKVVVTPAMV